MKRIGKLRAASTFCAIVLLQLCPNIQADTRPQMPARFDRDTVMLLLNNIEQKHNAAILRAGYFMRRGKTELPQNEGLALLKTAIEQETVASKKWFVMQSIYGFALFRVPGASHEEGLAAYATLFEHSSEAEKVGAAYQLNQAINEFVFSLNGRLNNLGFRTDNKTQETLLKAWEAYTETLSRKTTAEQSKQREPDWAKVIEKTYSSEHFLPHIEKALNTPAVPKTYYLLKTAANVYISTKPSRAIEIFQQAKPLLPPGDVEECADFYERLVKLLESEKQLADAIVAQKTCVEQFGFGHTKLAMLYWQAKDVVAVKEMVESLVSPDAKEREVVALAHSLKDLALHVEKPDALARDFSIRLLEGYLLVLRQRNVEQELLARQMLAELYLGNKEYKKASTILNIKHLEGLIVGSKSKRVQRSITLLKSQLDELAKN